MFATSNASVLSGSVQQIKNAISDFRNSSSVEEALHILEGINYLFQKEPLREFLMSVLPSIDFIKWWNELHENGEASGTFAITWHYDIEKRIKIQIDLCQFITTQKNALMNFTQKYFRPQSQKISEYFAAFATKVLDPLVRDIGLLIEFRAVSPILLEAMRNFPISGDDTLDELLQEACRKFKDPAPQSLQDATEKLWDSWERIKSLENPDNKKQSVKVLLEKGSDDMSSFYNYLEQEAKALTDIGNQFQLRHFEVGKQSLTSEQLGYLFHRLYSLIRFLLLARNKN
jgi:hypothetical protein